MFSKRSFRGQQDVLEGGAPSMDVVMFVLPQNLRTYVHGVPPGTTLEKKLELWKEIGGASKFA